MFRVEHEAKSPRLLPFLVGNLSGLVVGRGRSGTCVRLCRHGWGSEMLTDLRYADLLEALMEVDRAKALLLEATERLAEARGRYYLDADATWRGAIDGRDPSASG